MRSSVSTKPEAWATFLAQLTFLHSAATLASMLVLFHTQALLWGLTSFSKVNKLLCELTATFCLDALPGNVPLTFILPLHTLYTMCICMARQLHCLYSTPWHLCIKFTIPRSTAYCLLLHVKITSGKTSLDCLYTYQICPNLTKYHKDNKKKETEVEENLSFVFSNLL